MSEIPEDLKYTKEHEWAKTKGEVVSIGITAFAVEQLGDVTFVELPKVGTQLESGKTFGVVESVKSVSDLYAPMSGTVTAVNEALVAKPELLNEGAYAAWMIELRPADPSAWSSLLDAAAYGKIVLESQ